MVPICAHIESSYANNFNRLERDRYVKRIIFQLLKIENGKNVVHPVQRLYDLDLPIKNCNMHLIWFLELLSFVPTNVHGHQTLEYLASASEQELCIRFRILFIITISSFSSENSTRTFRIQVD